MKKNIKTKVDKWHIKCVETNEKFWTSEKDIEDIIHIHFYKYRIAKRGDHYTHCDYSQINGWTFKISSGYGRGYEDLSYEVYELKLEWMKRHYPDDWRTIKIF